MMNSLAEILKHNFYQWEKPLRGGMLSSTYLDVEPIFKKFSYPDRKSAIRDDSKQSTIVEDISKFGKWLFSSAEKHKQPLLERETPVYSSEFCIYQISIPKEYKFSLFDQLLRLLVQRCKLYSYEIIIRPDVLLFQLAFPEEDQLLVKTYFNTYFPEIAIEPMASDSLSHLATKEQRIESSRFKISEEVMRPLQKTVSLDLDIFIPLLAFCKSLQQNEIAVVQILFKGSQKPWAESLMKSVLHPTGKQSLFTDQDMISHTRDKSSAPFVGVQIQSVTQSDRQFRAEYLNKELANIICQSSSSSFNKLRSIKTSDRELINDMVERKTRCSPMLLNSSELTTFIHFPCISVATELQKNYRKTKAAPEFTQNENFIIGINEHNGRAHTVSLSDAIKQRHGLILGASGSGKSYAIRNMVIEEANRGNGVCVLDPHNDLIDDILSYIPVNRTNDVIIFDLGDTEFPLAFNILSAHSDVEREVLSSDLISAFRKHSYSWGDGLNSIFSMAISTFLHSTEGGTLSDLRRFLIDKKYRSSFLKSVTDPTLIHFWEKEFPLLRSGSVGSIITRLDSFLRPKAIRNIVCQPESLSFEKILDEQKLLFIKVPHGLVGVENAHLIGTFFITKIFQAALARQGKKHRPPFYLYIDEVQNFVTPTLVHVLNEGRKFGVGLYMASQHTGMLEGELNQSVIANVATRICFRLGDTDAKKLAPEFSHFEADDLKNLKQGQAIVRIDRPDQDFSLTTLPTNREKNAGELIIDMINHSREKYCNPRREVELRLSESLQQEYDEGPVQRSHAPKNIIPTEITPPTQSAAEELPSPRGRDQDLLKRKQESHHRYLQNYFKRIGELNHFKATIEAIVDNGSGRVDVLLERGPVSIAIEIKHTTKPDWEIHNFQKCLNSGYTEVICCVANHGEKEIMKKKIQESSDASVTNVQVFTSDELTAYLNSKSKAEVTEHTMKGYKVQVDFENDADLNEESGESLAEILLSRRKKKHRK